MKQRYNNLSIFQYILLIRRTRLWSRKWIKRIKIINSQLIKPRKIKRQSLQEFPYIFLNSGINFLSPYHKGFGWNTRF